MTDPIADYLTRLRNALKANHKIVNIPASNIKREITKTLMDKGYILNFKVETAEEMFNETKNNLPVNVAIFLAAVADFKLKNKNIIKIKKEENLVLNLEKNIDILSYVSNHNSARPNLVIGFAAETNDLEKNSKKKLLDKNCDWIIANNVSDSSIGFDSDYNEVSIYYKDTQFKSEKISKRKKSKIADEITNRIVNQLN